MNKIFKTILYSSISLSIANAPAYAGEEWYMAATVNTMPGTYSGSDERKDLLSSSIVLDADYLDNFSFSLAYNNFNINFKDLGAGEFKIKQNAYAGKIQYHYFSDSYKGTISTQLVVHSITNNDATKKSDEVTVFAPKIAYTNLHKDIYFDIEYVNSNYPGLNDLTVNQFSPTFGYGFNQGSDWIKFKAYFIQSNDKQTFQGEDSFSSLNMKWTHWLAPKSLLGINNLFIDALVGERIFAVDNDAFSVYNLADIQQGSVLVGAGWKPISSLSITAILGVEKYENKSISNVYNQQYLYISLTKSW